MYSNLVLPLELRDEYNNRQCSVSAGSDRNGLPLAERVFDDEPATFQSTWRSDQGPRRSSSWIRGSSEKTKYSQENEALMSASGGRRPVRSAPGDPFGGPEQQRVLTKTGENVKASATSPGLGSPGAG